jgi:RNA polymerase sigma-70 factor (family 1)
MEQENEQVYWQKVSRGDKKAFEHLFNTYYQPLCRYAGAMLRDADEAEEAVQNLFFTIWSRRETLQITSSFKSYVYRAVHNDCLNRIKHGKVKAGYASDYRQLMSGASLRGDQVLEARELGNRIREAMEALPEQCRQVFTLSRFASLKYQEIAGQLGISVKTVENHMGKALRLLRIKLKDYLPVWLLMIVLFNA